MTAPPASPPPNPPKATRQIKFIRPALYRKQFEAIYDPARISCVEASTKSGKTVGCMTWLYEKALAAGPGQQCWWVAPVFRQALIAFGRYQRFISPKLTDRQILKGEKAIVTVSGCKIVHLSGENPDNLYGDDVVAAVMDEASRSRPESWHAVRTTLTQTGGPVRLIGNVRGRKNWFYGLCRKAEAGEPGMAFHRIDAMDAVRGGIFPLAEIEEARRVLPPNAFKELYEAQAGEDEANPFDPAAIRDCTMPLGWLGPGPVVAWGIDVARSIDWTVLTGLNKALEVCEQHRFQRGWEWTFNEIVRLVGKRTPALLDATGVGDPLVARLQAAGHKNVEGYVFSQRSKQVLMEGLSMEIQGRHLKFPDGVIRSEIDQFEYHYTLRGGVTYTAPEGLHDDTVMALALAVHRFRNRPRSFGAPGAVGSPHPGSPYAA